LAAPAVFAVALANLLDVANLLGNAEPSTLQPDQLGAQVMASIASFGNGWDMSLAIFGLHLVGLGYLLFKSVDFPRFLGVLVVIAGGGYLADTFARILVPDFEFTFSLITFVGEALLIVWLFWRAIKGFPSETEPLGGQLTEPRLVEPSTVAP
jgi:membrane protein implicated in regulation of membrane protease activity